jgi:hypothetical protein
MTNSLFDAVVRALLTAAVMACVTPEIAVAQVSDSPVDPLKPLEFLIGRWTGTSEGEPGTGSVEREYTRVLNGRYIQVRSRVVYGPQAKNPHGETHEEIGIISFDAARRVAVLRQFHVEGFVNQYVGKLADGADKFVFTTEAIENLPTGWRARETYEWLGADRLEEVFELAEPRTNYQVYSRVMLKRVR